MQPKYAWFFVLCVALFTTGCDSEPSSQPLELEFEGGLDLPMPSGVVLRKQETDAEKTQTKADSFDVRGQYQDIYGITEAPNAANVRAIAEFENTDAVLVAWEYGIGEFLIELIGHIAAHSDVWVVTWNLSDSAAVRQSLTAQGIPMEKVRFFEFPHESFWTRDYGPVSVVDQSNKIYYVDPRYYPQRRRDDAIPTLMSRYFGVGAVRPNLATEGGNFMTNGEGICVVTEWLFQENPRLDARSLQTIQRDYFGCRQTIVLERLVREGTGHVDMFAKFLDPNTILVGEYGRSDPQNAALLDRNVERLESFALDNDWPLEIVRIPMPAGGNGVYRSYTNSLIVNDAVIVPTYRGDRRFEAEALEIYRSAMPIGTRVIPMDAETVIQLGGAVHCTTMGFVSASLPDLPAMNDSNLPDEVRRPSTDQVRASNASMLTINDNATTVDTLRVSESVVAFQVVLSLDLEHEYLGDLIIRLVHDEFDVVVLRNMGTGAEALNRDFVIDVPRGIDTEGEWRLIIEDTAAADVGILRSWGLRFNQ